MVIEFIMDEQQLKDREAKGEDVFQGVLKYRAPGRKAEVIEEVILQVDKLF